MFLDLLEKSISEHSLINKGEKILVGVSGGPDSIALLHGLHQLQGIGKWSLFVIHVNHSLRGRESDLDAQYVADLCQKWNITCINRKIDVQLVLEREGGNKQALARELRYQEYAKIADELDIHKIALAHHADDQVETILLRLLRGTGVSGLAGMNWLRKQGRLSIVRPLLNVKRIQIEHYCQKQQLEPRLDSSNQSMVYTRNRVRSELLPLLSTYNPQVQNAVLNLGRVIADEEEVWRERVAEICKEMVVKRGNHTYIFKAEPFLKLPVALQRRVVKLILNCLVKSGTNEISLDTVEQVRNLVTRTHPSAQIDLPNGIKAFRQYDKCLISTQESVKKSIQAPSTLIKVPGVTDLQGFNGEIKAILSFEKMKDPFLHNDVWTVFDADQLQLPLSVRSRKNGDRMSCMGMKGTKRVKNMLMEAKIPAQLRDEQAIIVDGKQIIWIPEIRRSNVALITHNTKRYLYLLWRSIRS